MSDSINSDREEDFAGRPQRIAVTVRRGVGFYALIPVVLVVGLIMFDSALLKSRWVIQTRINEARVVDVSNIVEQLGYVQTVQNSLLNMVQDGTAFRETNIEGAAAASEGFFLVSEEQYRRLIKALEAIASELGYVVFFLFLLVLIHGCRQ